MVMTRFLAVEIHSIRDLADLNCEMINVREGGRLGRSLALPHFKRLSGFRPNRLAAVMGRNDLRKDHVAQSQRKFHVGRAGWSARYHAIAVPTRLST